MKTSALRLTQSVKKEELEKLGFRFEHDTADHGWPDHVRQDQFPWYETGSDILHPASDNEAVAKNDILMEFETGGVSFTNLEDPFPQEVFVSPFVSYPLYSYPEVLQFLAEMENFDEKAFADSYKMSKFPLSNVIEEVCISISLPETENTGFGSEAIRFVRIPDLIEAIGKLNGGRALKAAFDGDRSAKEYLGDWIEFCTAKGLFDKLESFHISEFPILLNRRAMTNSSPDMDPSLPVIGLRVNSGFSVQYLLDYLLDTAEGWRLTKAIGREIKKAGTLSNHTVYAPKTLGGQILHSLATRHQMSLLDYQITRLRSSDVNEVKHRREFITRRCKMIDELCDNIEKLEGERKG